MAEVFEEKVAAACLRDMTAIQKLLDARITRAHFKDPVLSVIVGVALEYTPIQKELLTSDSFRMELARRNPTAKLERYLATFAKLVGLQVTKGELASAITSLKDQRIVTELGTVIENTISQIQKKEIPPAEIAKSFRQKALSVGMVAGVSYSTEGSSSDNLDERMQALIKRKENPEAYRGMLGPWTMFNEATNGLQPADMAVVVADPGFGKTTWLLNYSEHCYSLQNKNIFYASLEMPKERLEIRWDTKIGHRLFPEDETLTYRAIRDGNMSEDGLKKYQQILDFQRQKKNSLYIVDDPTLSVAQIREKIIQRMDEAPVDLAIIDYLGILAGANAGWSEISQIAAELYIVSRELKIPVITAAQRNPNGNVGLSYLIKAHCSILLGLNQSEDQKLTQEVEQEFLKNREGPLEKFTSRKNFARMALENIEEFRGEGEFDGK